MISLDRHLRLIAGLCGLAMLTAAALQPVTATNSTSLPDTILQHAMQPDAALLLVCGGWLLLCVEFCRPGVYVYGGAGVLAMTLGGYAMAVGGGGFHPHAVGIFAVVLTGLLTLELLRVAWRARVAKLRPDGSSWEKPTE